MILHVKQNHKPNQSPNDEECGANDPIAATQVKENQQQRSQKNFTRGTFP
jgi:hypothetical protein